jgi:hypothetical protein
MKSIIKFSALALALAGAQQAAAEDFVLTGSTAFRSATYSALQAIMTGETIVHSHASSLSSSNQATFKGTYPGIAGTTYVYCSWSGSATGVIAAANDTPVSVISQATVDAQTAGTTTPGIAPNDTKLPRFAFSDVYKESTSAASAALTDSRPAVIPFRFVKNRASAAGLTNVTAQQVRALWNNNSQPLALFTGNPADTDLVIGTGRDNGSGTRITVLAETKYGIGNLVQQWKVTTSGSAGSGTATSAQIWAIGDGVGSTAEGNGGYSSGSNIATIMGMSSGAINLFEADGVTAIDSGIPVTILAWLGLSDASTAIGTGATGLSYEGVAYSADAVYEGQYTLWGYLHLYYKTPVGSETTFRTALSGASGLGNATVLGTNGLLISAMHCARGSDGGIVGR